MNSILKQFMQRIEKKDIKTVYVSDLLDAYYQSLTNQVDGSFGSVNIVYPAELRLPLSERQSGIWEALTLLMNRGHVMLVSDDGYTALIPSIANADEPMTAFMLSKGADPYIWPDMDELPAEMTNNYYLEDIDVQYLNASFNHDEEYQEALLRTAQTLVNMSGLRDFGGLCLSVDENGEISLEAPKKI